MSTVVREGSIDEAMNAFDRVPEFHENPKEQFWTAEEVMLRIRDAAYVTLIAEVEGQIAGALIGYDKHNDGSAYCWLAGVDANLRRHGALRHLMQSFERWSQEQGFDRVTITTRNSRRSMLLFLVNNGFDITSVRENANGVRHNRIDFMKKLNRIQ